MSYLATFLATAAFVGCNSAGSGTTDKAKPQPMATDAAAEFLVTTAANDFHNHRSPYPLSLPPGALWARSRSGRHHKVHAVWRISARIRGRHAEWTPFVTIKTDPYEQWLGAHARGYCEQPSIVWLDGEYSSLLQ